MCSDSFDIKNFYVSKSQINVIFCMTSLYVFRSTISVRCARRTVLIIHNAAVSLSVAAKLNLFFSEKQIIFFFRFSKRRKIMGGLRFPTAHSATRINPFHHANLGRELEQEQQYFIKILCIFKSQYGYFIYLL